MDTKVVIDIIATLRDAQQRIDAHLAGENGDFANFTPEGNEGSAMIGSSISRLKLHGAKLNGNANTPYSEPLANKIVSGVMTGLARSVVVKAPAQPAPVNKSSSAPGQ